MKKSTIVCSGCNAEWPPKPAPQNEWGELNILEEERDSKEWGNI